MKISYIKPKAVLIGVLTAMGGYTLVGLFLGIIIVIIAAIGHDMSPAYLTALRGNISVRLVGLMGATLSTCLGGYVAARIARSSIFWNSFAVGCLLLTLMITLAVLWPTLTPPWKLLIGLVVTIPAALLGGYINRRHDKPLQTAEPSAAANSHLRRE